MGIKTFLIGSSAVIFSASSAHAADAVVVAEPEPVEYVRVCDTYGAGFFYIPGTETCLKIGGYLRYDVRGGDDPLTGVKRDSWYKRTRASLRFDARSETELGTLRSYIETYFQYTNGSNNAYIPKAYIELGGFRVGAVDSQFTSWTNYAGDIINDNVIAYGPDKDTATNQISYTFKGGNGFSAMLGFEQGSTSDFGYNDQGHTKNYVIDDYTPHIVGGLKFEQGWGKLSGVVGYDALDEVWAGKVRLDVKFSNTVSAFLMGGYQSDWNKSTGVNNYYANWEGDYAIWAGLSAKLSDKATLNGQVAYEEYGNVSAALNVRYKLVPGFDIIPEVTYTNYDDNRGDPVEGRLRLQRNF
ncbi:porin [Phyllobacterium sp. OV277]|uniref:porin n=1 Tax=Phyllobacterium sp. OV277 TaxID=1882772 RepID=UPI00087F1C51|nr:porin [Phyllobacterium sp. OV277]SDP68732.1 Porin subfamily protein [Phyllobacterium sp. OV277]